MEETHIHGEEIKQEEGGEEVKAQLAHCEKEKNEFIDLSRRLKADFANAKKDQEKEMAFIVQCAHEGLLIRLFPILDSLYLAIKRIPKDIEEHNWVVGIKSIVKQMEGILKDIGVTEISVIAGTAYNIYKHEAILEVESEGDAGMIAEELQKGYALYDKIIRPAKISITKNLKLET